MAGETILSPYGEGYCRRCCFIIGLGPDGRLDHHSRGNVYGEPKVCEGGGRPPAKVTPYASRKSAFKVRVPEDFCPGCRRLVPTTTHGGQIAFAKHRSPEVRPDPRNFPWCYYSCRPVYAAP